MNRKPNTTTPKTSEMTMSFFINQSEKIVIFSLERSGTTSRLEISNVSVKPHKPLRTIASE
jgi:hypothetical protein